jgi:hypothetical protein
MWQLKCGKTIKILFFPVRLQEVRVSLNCYSIWHGCVIDLNCVIEFLLIPENIPRSVIKADVPLEDNWLLKLSILYPRYI